MSSVEVGYVLISLATVAVMLLIGEALVIVYLHRRATGLVAQVSELRARLDVITRDRDGWRDVGERGLRMLQISHANTERARALIGKKVE